MATAKRVVVFLPTYNEAQNVRLLFSEIRGLLPDATILFIDDNSPDGTGSIINEIVAEDVITKVIHRPAKMGIGSAHVDAINWAYDHSFHILITMDCDMAHSPAYIMQFLEADQSFALVTGSRFKSENSLNEWNLYRKLLTHLGHFLTRVLLGMPFDATGAFRRYDLTQIPRAFLGKVSSNGYSFFFESLHVLYVNGVAVFEIPIKLPARTYGSSKMRLFDVFRGFGDLLKQWFKGYFNKSSIIISDQ